MNERVKILAKFKYNKKIYIIAVLNNKVAFYIYENNKYEELTNKEDFDVCNYILDGILAKKESSIYICNKKINHNIYSIYYDFNTRLHWWKPFLAKESQIEDNIALNFLYNNISLIVALEKEKTKQPKKNYFTRIISFKGFMIYVVIVATLIPTMNHFISNYLELESYSGYGRTSNREFIESLNDAQVRYVSDLNKYINSEQSDKKSVYNTQSREYNWALIQESINSNKHLTKEEKKFIEKMKTLFEDKHKYMDIELIRERIRNLEFTYFDGTIPFAEDASGVTINSIYHIYFADSKQINDVLDFIKFHELIHYLQSEYHTGRAFEYGTQIATMEYIKKLAKQGKIQPSGNLFDSYGGFYTEDPTFYEAGCKILSLIFKLIDEETRWRFIFEPDEGLLINALAERDNSNMPYNQKKEKATRLVDNLNHSPIDSLKSVFDSLQKGYYKNSIGDNIEELALFGNQTMREYFFSKEEIEIQKKALKNALKLDFDLPDNYTMSIPSVLFDDEDDEEKLFIYFKYSGEQYTVEITDDIAKAYREQIPLLTENKIIQR